MSSKPALLLVGGIIVVVLGYWMWVQGSQDQSVASAVEYGDTTDFFLGQSPSHAAESSDLRQRGELLSIAGPIAMLAGGGTAVIGFVLAVRSPGAKGSSTQQAGPGPLPDQPPAVSSARQACPYCGESIPVLAHICRFCHRDLNPTAGGTSGST